MTITTGAAQPPATLPAFARRHGRLAAMVACGVLPFAVQVKLYGAPPNRAANDFFEFRLQQIVGFGRANCNFQVPVIQGSQFDGQAEAFTLIMCLAIAGHA